MKNVHFRHFTTFRRLNIQHRRSNPFRKRSWRRSRSHKRLNTSLRIKCSCISKTILQLLCNRFFICCYWKSYWSSKLRLDKLITVANSPDSMQVWGYWKPMGLIPRLLTPTRWSLCSSASLCHCNFTAKSFQGCICPSFSRFHPTRRNHDVI